MVWFVRKPSKKVAIVAGAVGIGITVSRFPAGYFPYCASPAGGGVGMVLAPLVASQLPRTSWAHLEQQARYPFPSLRMSGGCHVTLRAASIGEAAFLFPSAPAPRGEQAKAADSLPECNGAALHSIVIPPNDSGKRPVAYLPAGRHFFKEYPHAPR